MPPARHRPQRLAPACRKGRALTRPTRPCPHAHRRSEHARGRRRDPHLRRHPRALWRPGAPLKARARPPARPPTYPTLPNPSIGTSHRACLRCRTPSAAIIDPAPHRTAPINPQRGDPQKVTHAPLLPRAPARRHADPPHPQDPPEPHPWLDHTAPRPPHNASSNAPPSLCPQPALARLPWGGPPEQQPGAGPSDPLAARCPPPFFHIGGDARLQHSSI